MKIAKATEQYESWLGKHLHLIPEDLEFKHQQMRLAPFPFLRATYYRWAQTWEDICGAAARWVRVLAIGDLHVENFGTWRDVEGRLIWGINDFDEASRLPYTNDLIRLGTSVLIAQLSCDLGEAMLSILNGYRDALKARGLPFALAEHHTSLRLMAVQRLHDPEAYWAKLHALPDIKNTPPAGAIKAILRMMPERTGIEYRIAHRVAGLGSLGRERYVAIGEWRGGSIAREAKALAPSACVWAKSAKGSEIHYQEILEHSVRCRDPFVHVLKRWIVRRLAPDCSRIELSALPKERDEFRLLYAMGWETANIHLGSAKPAALIADFDKRPRGWLLDAARKMEKAVRADFEDYSTR